MGQVKQIARTFNKLTTPEQKPVVPDSPLKDPLKDALKGQPILGRASSPGTESVKSGQEGPSLKAIIEDASEAILDEGGTDVTTYEAFVAAIADLVGADAVAAAGKELMMEVKASDKRVARSFSDTVKGHGGAAWIPPRLRNEEEEEEEDEEDLEKPVAKPAVETD